MRVLFLNQYFPPDPAPTGLLFGEIARALEARGHEVQFVAAREDYHSEKRHRRRLLRELGALFSIARQAMKAERADVIVSGSSPPCLAILAAAVALIRGGKTAHWAMDLYPELAVALGEIPKWAAWPFGVAMRWAYRRMDAVVAVDDDMNNVLAQYGLAPKLISPWVPDLEDLKDAPREGGESFTWMYSGNLGRAHDWSSLLLAQSLLESMNVPATLIFQGGGAGQLQARSVADVIGLKRCEWRDYAPREELVGSLMKADVLVATQDESTRGMLWPSKLALLRAMPQPVLWIGPTDGCVAEELKAEFKNGVFSDSFGAAAWLQEQTGHRKLTGSLDTEMLVRDRDKAVGRWVGLIESLA